MALAPRAPAEDAAWPSRPVRLILPFTPGGSTDFQGRILCDMLTRHFGQSFYLDYKPGAGSNIGVAEVGARPLTAIRSAGSPWRRTRSIRRSIASCLSI